MSQHFQRAVHALSAYVGNCRRVTFSRPSCAIPWKAADWKLVPELGSSTVVPARGVAQAPQYASVERCQLGAGTSYVAVPQDT